MSVIDDLKAQLSDSIQKAYDEGVKQGSSDQAAADKAPIDALTQEAHSYVDKIQGELNAIQPGATQPAAPSASSDAPAAPTAPAVNDPNQPAPSDSTSQPDPSVAQSSEAADAPDSSGSDASQPAGS